MDDQTKYMEINTGRSKKRNFPGKGVRFGSENNRNVEDWRERKRSLIKTNEDTEKKNVGDEMKWENKRGRKKKNNERNEKRKTCLL